MNRELLRKQIGKEIKITRVLLGLTQGQLGKKVNLCASAISNYERGEVSPSADVYIYIRSLAKDPHFSATPVTTTPKAGE